MRPGVWRVDRVAAPAAALHLESAGLIGAPVNAARAVRVLAASDRCVVLGSAQPAAHVDPARLSAAGWNLTRRRSGGSAVVVGPGEVLWVDVVVPSGDPLWVSDVGRAVWWLGSLWAKALRVVGLEGVAWRGGLVRSRWSDRMCFAGLGPGEVTVGGRKVVGVAQRRTRAGALFQCALLVRWAPGELLDVLAAPPADRAAGRLALADSAMGIGAQPAGLVLEAFLAGLDSI